MLSGINQASHMASLLFAKLDTKSQGYLEKSDLAAAFGQIAGNASQSARSTSAEDVFTALDSNSDGKVTADEFASVLAKLQESVSSQFGHGHAHGAGGMPPPPPPANDAGFTKEELSSQLESADGSDSKRSDLISKIVNNFEAADTDSDGKVSFKEAMAYDKSTQTAADTATTTTANNTDAQLLMKIVQLMHAYGAGQEKDNSAIASMLSVTA